MITNIMGTDVLVDEIQSISPVETPNFGFTFYIVLTMKRGKNISISVSDRQQWDLHTARGKLLEQWKKFHQATECKQEGGGQ